MLFITMTLDRIRPAHRVRAPGEEVPSDSLPQSLADTPPDIIAAARALAERDADTCVELQAGSRVLARFDPKGQAELSIILDRLQLPVLSAAIAADGRLAEELREYVARAMPKPIQEPGTGKSGRRTSRKAPPRKKR